ncbi:hypothetical protein H6G33_07690 [Calothrix sp. FACHB-1219]|uniref:hypothetical protein n=1 Tax=unclassified Calothrix TaxID=2619626 RepID=UPI000B5FDA5E|nr:MULTISPECIES: hypothetical protein [unclassified Calothrix]MBD2207279.1 hypothetical protein [Calothrix sp. FACHB-168]MBD2216910.1 hypothetical protein [Calothrix sp. FACHB-1219]BAY66578.1 hypothetical protein NIES22_67180 [Calothrix brevissima NIES-22]
MIRNSKKYSIDIDKTGPNIAINISLEIEMSPELIDLVLRDLRSDARDFNEARIITEIIRDPIIIYSLCQRIEQVKNQDNRYPEVHNEELNNPQPRNSNWSLNTASYTSNEA